LDEKLVKLLGAEKAEEITEFNAFVEKHFKPSIINYVGEEIERLKSKMDEGGGIPIGEIGEVISHSLLVGMHFYREFAIRNGVVTIDIEKDENANFGFKDNR